MYDKSRLLNYFEHKILWLNYSKKLPSVQKKPLLFNSSAIIQQHKKEISDSRKLLTKSWTSICCCNESIWGKSSKKWCFTYSIFTTQNDLKIRKSPVKILAIIPTNSLILVTFCSGIFTVAILKYAGFQFDKVNWQQWTLKKAIDL